VLELLVELLVEPGEVLAVAARRQDAGAVELHHARLEPGHALVQVGDPGGLAHLAVVDDVDAGLGLAAHLVGDRLLQRALIGVLVVGLAAVLELEELEQLGRPDQAAGVRSEDFVGVSHAARFFHSRQFCQQSR
jgi:hypothetical protein